MTTTGDPQARIEEYLGKLRCRLRGVHEEEVREIVEELRSHILEKAAASGEVTPAAVEAALAALGTPEDLASQYLTDNLLERAEVSRSPLTLLKGLFRWASLSFAGFLVLIGSLAGYFFGAVFMFVAVAKLIHPRTAGLWTYLGANGDTAISFRMGAVGPPVNGKDLLGWWIIPIGWIVGAALVMLTTSVAVWFVRQYRRSAVPRQG